MAVWASLPSRLFFRGAAGSLKRWDASTGVASMASVHWIRPHQSPDGRWIVATLRTSTGADDPQNAFNAYKQFNNMSVWPDDGVRDDEVVFRFNDQHVAFEIHASGERAAVLRFYAQLAVGFEVVQLLQLPLRDFPIAVLVERRRAEREPSHAT